MFINPPPSDDSIEASFIELCDSFDEPDPETWIKGEEFDVPGVGRVRVCGKTAFVVAAEPPKAAEE